MTIHALYLQEEPPADTTQTDTAEANQPGLSTAYDSIWTAGTRPSSSTQTANTFERVMLSQDKIYVVLAVVLIIWIGIALLIFHTDRRLRRLERSLGDIDRPETNNPEPTYGRDMSRL